MPDKYDPYREALVMEEEVVWPDDAAEIEPAELARMARELHDDPQAAEQIEYIRTHTGFCRRIVVTPGDWERVR